MKFNGRIQLIEPNQLPGAAVYNPLARAIKYMRSLSPLLLLGVTPAGGVSLDFRESALLEMLGGEMPFSCTVEGEDKLLVAAGTVWLCDRRLEAEKRKLDLSGPLSVWVQFTKAAAEIKTGKDFPPALDIAERRCNWPLAAVEKKDGAFEVQPHHVGDIVVLTMPHIFLPGYDAGATLVRICRNGNERYIETGECEDDDE